MNRYWKKKYKTDLNLIAEKAFFIFYNLGWKFTIPFLKLVPKLADGFDQRMLKTKIEPAELWIQSASAGESYLVSEILKTFDTSATFSVLATANTRQGIEILENTISELKQHNCNIRLSTAYFPFDRPFLMAKAVHMVKPKLMVLVETELWPGHLAALKAYGSKVLIINARMNEKSLKGYMLWPYLWKKLAPDKILAISENYKKRFSTLFGRRKTDVMPNIKFDRIAHVDDASEPTDFSKGFLKSELDILVLGSIRKKEEHLIKKIVLKVISCHPDTVICLFPRHLSRIVKWKEELKRLNLKVILRSKILEQIDPGTIVLWDVFGELGAVYGMAKAAFVGGSLAPLGGQNFIEAVVSGIVPVIGPYWDNFEWAGNEIVDQKLVKIASNWKKGADFLVNDLKNPKDHEAVKKVAQQYINERKGGAAIACDFICSYLKEN